MKTPADGEVWCFAIPRQLPLSAVSGLKVKLWKTPVVARRKGTFPMATVPIAASEAQLEEIASFKASRLELVEEPLGENLRLVEEREERFEAQRVPDRIFHIRLAEPEIDSTKNVIPQHLLETQYSLPVRLPDEGAPTPLIFVRSAAGHAPVTDLRPRFFPNGSSRSFERQLKKPKKRKRSREDTHEDGHTTKRKKTKAKKKAAGRTDKAGTTSQQEST